MKTTHMAGLLVAVSQSLALLQIAGKSLPDARRGLLLRIGTNAHLVAIDGQGNQCYVRMAAMLRTVGVLFISHFLDRCSRVSSVCTSQSESLPHAA